MCRYVDVQTCTSLPNGQIGPFTRPLEVDIYAFALIMWLELAQGTLILNGISWGSIGINGVTRHKSRKSWQK